MKGPVIFFLSLFLFYPPAANQLCKVDSKQNSTSFEYFMFVQQSPAAACLFHPCNKERYNLWTIHGLWPTKIKGIYPQYCEAEPFDLSELFTLLPYMDLNWPGLFMHSTRFWYHEWCKHGTCSLAVDSLDTQHKFFAQVLDMHKKYNFETILSDSGIVPSFLRYPSIKEFNNAFVRALNVTAIFQCRQTFEWQVIYQIAVCFNKQLLPISCDSNAISKEKYICDENKEVYYYNKTP